MVVSQYKNMNEYSKEKQLKSKRIKLTQKQKGNISQQTRLEVNERSNGVCEICDSQRATQMAHITSRVRIEHKTTKKDLVHVCVKCHKYLDETKQGKKLKDLLNHMEGLH
jgi:hypothetical protein